MMIAPRISGIAKKISAIRLIRESAQPEAYPLNRPQTPPITKVPSAEKRPTRIDARAP